MRGFAGGAPVLSRITTSGRSEENGSDEPPEIASISSSNPRLPSPREVLVGGGDRGHPHRSQMVVVEQSARGATVFASRRRDSHMVDGPFRDLAVNRQLVQPYAARRAHGALPLVRW